MANKKSTTTRSRPKRGRERFILYSLLVIIAGLLGVIVAILPDAPGANPNAVAADSQTGVVPEQPVPEETVEPGIDEPGLSAEPAAQADEREGEAATELYPRGEEVPTAGQLASESDRELWWLPDPEVYGDASGVLYLILDDAGNNIGPLPEFLKFPGPLAVAVLPQLTYSVESAARTAAAGKEIMLHLPMEAVGGANPGPGTLTVGMNDREILTVIGENLGSVPGAVGVNNHMGSRVTADPRVMEIVLADLHRRDLYFVDSRTTVDSVTRSIATFLQIPFAERHVFLDNERSREAILQSVRGALELAHRQEAVVMIGHATVEELASVLNEIYPILIENGYRFGALSDLVAATTVPGA